MSTFGALANEVDADVSDAKTPASPSQGGFAELANQIDVKAAPTAVAPSSNSDEEPGYFSKVGSAAKQLAKAALKEPGKIKAGLGQAAMSMVTSSPIMLLKHGVEEGAYLQGQEPAQAAETANRVIPTNGYEPTFEMGKAVNKLGGEVMQPLVEAGQWGARKLGLSPAFQNLSGDFAPVVLPQLAVKSVRGTGAAVDAINKGQLSDLAGLAKDIGSQGSLPQMQARYAQLVEAGKAAEAAPVGPTPQQLRGQEPIQQPLSPENTPTKAPEITLQNATPELQQAIQRQEGAISQKEIQRHLEADSLPVQIQLSKGQASGDVHLLSDEFNRRATPQGKALADLYQKQNGQLIDNANAIRDRAAPEVNALDHVENGETLINAYTAKDAALKADISAKYKALEEANGGEFPLNGKEFVDAADKALAKKLKSHYVPPEVRSTLDDLRKGGTMTFEDFETLRSDLAETARSASDGKVRAAANIIRDQLEQLPMPQGAEHLKPLADAARSAAKARFDLLDSDPAYKAAVNNSVPPDKFVQKFIVNGNKADLATMRNNLVADPVAQQSIAAAAINYLKSRAGIINDNGNFSQAGYNKALAAIEPKIDYLFDPITAQQIKTLGQVARYTQEQPRGSYFNNSASAVTLMKNAAAAGAEGYINSKTLGGYGALKNIVTSTKETKAAQSAANPLGKGSQ